MLGPAMDTRHPCRTLDNRAGDSQATIREHPLEPFSLAQFRCELLDLRQLVSCTTPPSLGRVVLQLQLSTGDTFQPVPCAGGNKIAE